MRIAIAGATGLVGRELGSAARKAGHEVVELSRATGVDLVAGSDAELDRALAGAEVVVDVTNSPTIDRDGATAFFETVAERLGVAGTRAGVALLAGREDELDRAAHPSDCHVDLGAQATARAANGLIFRPPFLAPAACW